MAMIFVESLGCVTVLTDVVFREDLFMFRPEAFAMDSDSDVTTSAIDEDMLPPTHSDDDSDCSDDEPLPGAGNPNRQPKVLLDDSDSESDVSDK